jgi:hypothetical protein
LAGPVRRKCQLHQENSENLPRRRKCFELSPDNCKGGDFEVCPKGDAVVDFAAGYEGRLLGSIAARRCYIGIEPNRAQVRGFIKMAEAISTEEFPVPQLRFLNGPAEKEMLGLKRGSADLVFSSLPFFDWEHYSRSTNQSFRRYPLYEVWLARFLAPVILQSHRVLKKKGQLILNVTNGNRLPTPDDVLRIARDAGFRSPPTIHEMFFQKSLIYILAVAARSSGTSSWSSEGG